MSIKRDDDSTRKRLLIDRCEYSVCRKLVNVPHGVHTRTHATHACRHLPDDDYSVWQLICAAEKQINCDACEAITICCGHECTSYESYYSTNFGDCLSQNHFLLFVFYAMCGVLVATYYSLYSIHSQSVSSLQAYIHTIFSGNILIRSHGTLLSRFTSH